MIKTIMRADARIAGFAVAGVLLVGALTTLPLRAQAPVGSPTFEVASVKVNASGEPFSRLQALPGGRVVITNASLMSVMRTAFLLQEFQIVNGPDWLDRDRFDIAAKADGNPDAARLGGMLQRVLADRFGLRFHRETRELPVFALVMARGDGRLGPQLRASEISCAALRSGPPQVQPADRLDGRPSCGTRAIPGSVRAGGVGLAQFAATLSSGLGRRVIDRTGLSGEFDIDLLYTPDQGGVLPPPPAVPPPPTDGPSLFAALQEQLGLKLESTKGPVEVLVIDHVEHPAPD